MSDFAQLLEVGRINTPLPTNTSVPAVTGDGKCGHELSCTMGNWNNMGSGIASGYAYQWRAAATAINGATRDKYTPKSADIGKAVDCVVTARNLGGATAAPASNTITITAS